VRLTKRKKEKKKKQKGDEALWTTRRGKGQTGIGPQKRGGKEVMKAAEVKKKDEISYTPPIPRRWFTGGLEKKIEIVGKKKKEGGKEDVHPSPVPSADV